MKRVFLPFVLIVLSAAALISCSSTGKKQQPLNFQTAEIPADVVPEHFPLISIISTENGGSNSFVKDPVAAHVKEAQQSWYDFSNAGKPDPYYEVCTISVDGQEALPGQVKVRGNWTTNYDKKSLRIKLDNKQNLLGLNGGKKFKNWVLLACYTVYIKKIRKIIG